MATSLRTAIQTWSTKGAIRFNRHELAGAFGDIGTDFPLLTGMILTARLDVASVLTMFGLMQVLTGLLYRLPIPVQPLKAMAVIVITQKVNADVLYGGGLSIGILMLALALSGLLDRLGRLIPIAVIRGIQFGLGLQLVLLALKEYLPAEGAAGFGLAAVGFLLTLLLLGNRKLPPAILLILLGVGYGLSTTDARWGEAVGFRPPQPTFPDSAAILNGFLILALPQLPLSFGNSLLATRQTVADLFGRSLSLRRLGLTYAAMNLLNPLLGGVPTCHGSGGVGGHYAFGARTGGSVILYGMFYLTLGLFFSNGFHQVIHLFPKPILGVILLFEGLILLRLIRDMAAQQADFTLVLLIGLAAISLPYGYALGLVGGTILAYWGKVQLARF